MVKILIVDDNEIKIRAIREFLDKIHEIEEYDIAIDLVSARKELSQKHYDLVILDINLPNRVGDDALAKNGGEFLNELDKSARLIKPAHIIGLSAFDNSINEFHNEFSDSLWSLIKYDQASDDWSKKLTKKVNYLVRSKRDLSSNNSAVFQYDLGIITALRVPELESVLNLPANWKSLKLNNDATEYYSGIFEREDKKIKVIAASTSQMGMVPTAILANKLIGNFRPKHIAMTGIAGGIKGHGNFGDILAADLSFDSGSGKIKTNENGDSTFEPDYKAINLEADIKEALNEYKTNRTILNEIKQKWNGDCPVTELNIHIGPLASGSGVIENKKIIDEIKGHSRKLIGIDMETYALFYTAENCSKPRPHSALSLKSISDFADPEKNDSYQKYASYTSANLLYNFALDKMSFE